MKKFSTILEVAAGRKGGEKALMAYMPTVMSKSQLAKAGDDCEGGVEVLSKWDRSHFPKNVFSGSGLRGDCIAVYLKIFCVLKSCENGQTVSRSV